ncbi:MAG: 4Fe-4S dicluster domain-containing protein [Pelodictyon phaeoclathratiforme]
MIRPKLAEFKFMFLMMAVFTTVAIGFWQAFDQPFYLINFAIIGLSISLGMGLWPLLPKEKKPWARRLSQVLVGGYLFFGLGCGLIYLSFGVIVPENMEIEGFWFMVFAGVFQAAAIHYFVAKIVGPIFFNRGWCGWACWTAAVLDLLPWKSSPGRVPGRWGHLRYLHFALALGLVASLVFIFGYTVESQHGIVIYKEAIQTDTPQYTSMFMIPEMWWFLIGNLLYFSSGIVLAVVLKDNRAFCKYVCPIVGFLKPSASVSMTRIAPKNDRCTRCSKCTVNCPMDIDVMRYVQEGKPVLSTECVLCLTCTSVCPEEVLDTKMGLSFSSSDYLRIIKPASKRSAQQARQHDGQTAD